MANYKKYNLLLLFLLTGMIFVSDYSFSNDKNLKPEYFYGKVVYSDSNIPVNNGNVRIISVNNSDESRIIIAVSEIGENGEFRIPRNLVPQADGMEIMAYANDLDNIEFQYETKVTDFKEALETTDGKFDIILTVNRIMKSDSKD